jgi:hypothetical protein
MSAPAVASGFSKPSSSGPDAAQRAEELGRERSLKFLLQEFDREKFTHEVAETRLKHIQQKERDLLVAGSDDEIRAHDQDISRCRLQIRRGLARINKLTRLIAEARAREQEEAKLRAYEDAQRAATVARNWLTEVYERLCSEMVEGLTLCHAAQMQIEAVNKKANLPNGRARLDDVERPIRHREPTSRTAVYRPYPLFVEIELPGLRPGDAMFRVTGTQARAR